MRRRRWRTVTLRVGCTLSVLIAFLLVLSARWQIVFQVPTSRGPALGLIAGSVVLADVKMISSAALVAPHSSGLSKWNSWRAFHGNDQLFSGGPLRTITYLEAPLYAVFLAVLLPTLLIWRFCPKPVRPGHCPCGYDLHDNVSGRCPQCGVKAQDC